ncbi:MAG: hypothetical protein ACLFR1_16285, partial [Spirochaetia bacterium]
DVKYGVLSGEGPVSFSLLGGGGLFLYAFPLIRGGVLAGYELKENVLLYAGYRHQLVPVETDNSSDSLIQFESPPNTSNIILGTEFWLTDHIGLPLEMNYNIIYAGVEGTSIVHYPIVSSGILLRF